jgi:hypothetical protein
VELEWIGVEGREVEGNGGKWREVGEVEGRSRREENKLP